MHFQPLLPLLLALVLSSPDALANSAAEAWSRITQPTVSTDGSQSIGTFTSGCLAGAASLPLQGTGYQVMRLSRQRYFGHQSLIDFIEKLGLAVASGKMGTLLIGDLGQPRGGPTLTGHRSHQTGLDVDIWFLLASPANERLLSSAERENWSAPSVVAPSGDTVDYRAWSVATAKVLEAAARDASVDRIFVHPSIKQELCQQRTTQSGDWLRKIRPWWKHDDHFHVRLKCPANNRLCESQEPLPSGDGCDASLAWWFSDEAKQPAKSKPLPAPPLPAACERILRE